MNLQSTVSTWAAKGLARWLAKRARYETGTGADIIKIITEAWGGGKTAAGVNINEDRALTISAVYTAVRIIGGTMASLPLHVFRQTERGREFAPRHWAYSLLHDSPNAYHTSFTWRELMLAHVLLWGNHYSRIEWLKNGAAGELLPLMPWEVEPYRNDAGAQLYNVQIPGGSERLAAEEILHIPGLGYDGIKGLSVIRYQRDMLGTSKAMDLFTGSFFKNGAKPGAILETPGRMKEEAQKNLANSIAEKFGDVSDAFKVLVLEEGSKLHTYTMPLEDAQLLESRKLSRSEIFGLYGVPPHLGGDTERSTSWGTGIEQQDIGYAKHTITPWCVRIEQEINRKLFGRGSGVYSKFNLDGLQRGDFKSRMEGFRVAVGAPFLTRNEAREIEDWNTLGEEGMDQVITPLNMGVGAKPDPAPEATPAAPPRDPEDDGGRNIEVNVGAPVVNVSPPSVAVNLPEKFEHSVTHEHHLPDMAATATAIRSASDRMVRDARDLRQDLQNGNRQLEAGLAKIVKAVKKPRRAVYDKDGNPLGTVASDSLDK